MTTSNVVRNSKRRTRYYNVCTGILSDNPIDDLTAEIIAASNFEAHRSNVYEFYRRPDRNRPVVGGWVPIPAKSQWVLDENWEFSGPVAYPIQSEKAGLKIFLARLKKYLASLDIEKLGVEMSGGLDTGLIFGCLAEIGVAPAQIGMRSDRFEFRTERQVQNEFFGKSNRVRLVNDVACLPFTNLGAVPPHPVPITASLFFSRHNESAKASVQLGVKCLLHGLAGDGMLTPKGRQTNLTLPDEYYPWALGDGWANEFVFRPLGIEYLDPFILPWIWRSIICERTDQPEDIQKVWARKFFAGVLPDTLSKYAYKSGFESYWHDGLDAGVEEIRKICSLASRVTNCSEISVAAVEHLLIRHPYLNDRELKDLMARTSFANWIAAFCRSGKV